MAQTITYSIDGMRVVKPKGKTAEKNPDLALTVHGTAFWSVDDKGKRSDKLSITSKAVSKEIATGDLFRIDPVAGTLTLPEGRKGRTADAGMDADDLVAYLASLRGGEEDQAEEGNENASDNAS